MSKYQKAHPREKMENCDDFSVFLWAFVSELWLTEKKKERKKERFLGLQ